MRHITAIFFVLGAILLASHSIPAQAADTGISCSGGTCTYTLLEPLPGSDKTTVGGDSSSFYAYLNGIILILIIVGGMLAVVRFSIGGILYMTSEIANTRTRAKSQMWACIWGLLLLVSAVLILKTINPNLVSLNFFTDLSCIGKYGTSGLGTCSGGT